MLNYANIYRACAPDNAIQKYEERQYTVALL